jgi:Bacterial SH3 domain
MKSFLISVVAMVLGAVSATALAATGTVLRAEKLYSQPSASAKVAGNAAKGASVTILAKQGGWLRVTSGNTTGWIRLLSVRAGAGGLGGAGLGDVVGAATTKSDPSRVVAVAGLRGLNDEDLKQAKFNEAELARLETMKVTAAQARSFAGKSGLAAVNVPALPAPQAAQAPASTWESN